jgi:hypothetical protein
MRTKYQCDTVGEHRRADAHFSARRVDGRIDKVALAANERVSLAFLVHAALRNYAAIHVSRRATSVELWQRTLDIAKDGGIRIAPRPLFLD